LPLSAHSLCIEGHVLAEIEYFDDFEEILQNVRRIREKSWPVRIKREVECVGMRRYITSTPCVMLTPIICQFATMITRIPVLVPSPTNLRILLINDKFYVLAVLLNHIRHLDA
jgi:hypothetical protein